MSLQGNATADSVLRGKINPIDTLVVDAYDIAVKHGFNGTEEEWLESLKGADGKDGEKGDKGDTGAAPTDEQVNAWLDEHPEATTTVQDKSIEVRKFTDNLSRKIIGNKVYLSDYLDGDGVLHSISAKDPAVTAEQVRALDSGATLSNSYDWYIIQTLINEVPDKTTLVFDGTYMIDRPITIKRGHINLMSLDGNADARSLLRFTLTDKTTDFITIGLVAPTQIQQINISGIRFRGTLDNTTGGHSGNGIVFDNSGPKSSDCLCVNFDNCSFEHFKNGVYVGGGYYVSSHIRDCYFGYNVENGFYGKHTGEIQLNELIFDNIGSAENGLIFDTENQEWVRKTEGESAIVNISGCGITLRNVGGMNSTYGIIINDGSTIGMNLSGMYLENNTIADIYIKGTNVTNLCILDAFSDMKSKVISTDQSILDKAVIPLLTEKIVNSGVFKKDLSVQRPVFHKQRALINNRHAVHLSKTDAADVCDFKCNDVDKATVGFDYEYTGAKSGDTYAYIEYLDMFGAAISLWLNQEDKLYPTVLIKDDKTTGTTITLDEMLPDDVTHIVLRQLPAEEFYEWENAEIKNLAPTSGGVRDVVGTNVLVSVDRKTLDFANSIVNAWFSQHRHILMIPVAIVSAGGKPNSTMHHITVLPLAGSHASVSINLNTDSGVLPCYSEIVKTIRLCLNSSKLPEDTDVNIANVKINA